MKYTVKHGFSLKALCLVLACCLVSGGVCFSAGAAETDIVLSEVFVDPDTYESGASAFSEELINAVTEGFRNHEEYVNIRKYNIKKELADDLFFAVLFSNPDMFYITPSVVMYNDDNSPYLTVIGPEYIYSLDEIPERTKEFEAAADRLISGVTPSMSQAEKALEIHDNIALNCEYASEELINSEDESIFTAYGCLVNEVAVCQGYALAYNYLLSKVGVNACFVNSDSMNHAWSMVEVDGNYYHVDVTWDDPVSDKLGLVRHQYFLQSDEAMINENEHSGWTSDYTASDKSYDEYFWSDIDTKIYIEGATYYYICNKSGRSNKGNLVKYEQGTESVVLPISERWAADPEKLTYWTNNFAFLVKSGEGFYYNTPDKVYYVNIDGSGKKEVYTVNEAQKAIGDIYGLAVKSDGCMYISLADMPNSVMTNQKISLTGEEPATTEPATTEPPTTEPPTTEPPTTEPPTTEPPTTEPSTTEPPTTEPPTTEPPTTEPPTTEPPTTEPPTTEPPTTEPPTTEPPTTEPPTTEPPTTEPPTTEPATTEPVQPTEVVLTDENTNISVVTDTDAELVVETLTSREDVEAVYAVLGDTNKLITVYDISLVKDGVAVQPDGAVKVKIPASSENAKVYRIEADGTLTDMNAVFTDGCLEFTAERLNAYAVAQDKPESTPDEPVKIKGDVNSDGEYNIRDAAAIQLKIAQLYNGVFDESVADVNGDGEIGIKDAAYIQLDLAKLL